MKTLLTVFLSLFLILNNSKTYSQYAIQEAFPNLTFAYPIEMVHPGDGTNRLFLVEKAGRILVFENNPNVSTTKTFIDISGLVSDFFYGGLFGIAFHPDYEINHYFYVYYTSGSGANQAVNATRFTASSTNPDSAIAGSEFNILTAACPSSNHNGSSIRFGSDGFLYLGFGDSSPGSGGDPNNKAQNRSELFGKVHRINVDSASGGRNYSIPPTNPFYQNLEGFREEIFAYGFRNMWKFSFDEITGRLWLADVGQFRWEEVNIVELGKNYGWRRKEGTVCYNPPSNCDTAGFVPTDLLVAYDHSQGASITGGYVYRGSKMPGLYGKYICSDYTSGRIRAITWDSTAPPVSQELFDTPYNIVSFAEDSSKNLYFMHFAATTGKIYKIVDTTLTSISGTNETPEQYFLYQNYPNPFNPKTIINYELGIKNFVSIVVYDVLGNEVARLIDANQNAGEYKVEFDGSNFPCGIYFYKLTAGDFSELKKMTHLK